MDLSKVKTGNDFLLEMFKDNQVDAAQDAAAEGVQGVDGQNVNVEDSAIEPDLSIAQGSADTDTPDNGSGSVEAVANQTDNDLITDWDPLTVSDKVDDKPKYDFKSLGKALDLEDIDSEDKLISHYKTVVSKNKELEKISADFTSAPEPLREALEVAKAGGDYLEYLGISTVDYDSIDDRSLYEESLINLGLFVDKAGNIDEDGLAEYIDSLPEKTIGVEAAKVRAQAKQQQAIQKQAIVQKAEAQRQATVKALRDALNSMESVGPFKLSESHRKAMFDDMSSGQIMKVLFYDSNGKFDYQKAARIYFKEKYEQRINQLLSDAVKNQTTKKIANDLKNVDLNNNGRPTNPTTPNNAVDPIDAWMAKMMKSGK